jgi:hypothetical protein
MLMSLGAFRQQHQAVGIVEREGSPQQGVNDAENGAHRAYSNRQREDGYDRKTWMLPQHSESVSNISR